MASFEHVQDALTKVLTINKDTPVIFEAMEGRLYIGTYNDHHSVVIEVPTTWDSFKFVLTSEVARALPKMLKEYVSFEVGEGAAKVLSKGTRATLNLLDRKSLMLSNLVTHFSYDVVWEADGEEFAQAVKRVQHSANNQLLGDVGMKSYNFSYIPESNEVELVTTTISTMSLTRFPVTLVAEEVDPELRLLLNPEFHAITRLLVGKTSIAYNENAISLTSTTEDGVVVRVVSALTGNVTPVDYKPLLESMEGNELLFTIPGKDLYEAVRQTNFFSGSTQKHRITLTASAGTLRIAARNMHGDAAVSLQYSDVGRGHTFDIGGDTLEKFLAGSKGADVQVSAYVDEDSPTILLTNEDAKEIISLYHSHS